MEILYSERYTTEKNTAYKICRGREDFGTQGEGGGGAGRSVIKRTTLLRVIPGVRDTVPQIDPRSPTVLGKAMYNFLEISTL